MKSNYLLFILLVFSFFSCREEKGIDYTDYVNVFIGTGGHGHTFPGATLPHGMVQLSPDTRLKGWDACAGYYYGDSIIHGFTHTHLNGTGRGDYGDILFMPFRGENKLIMKQYRSGFSHDNEYAYPGYYRVLLDRDSINVELTATYRAGMHRYTFSGNADNKLIIDMEPTIHNHPHPVTKIKVLNDSTICGMKYTEGWAMNHKVYFYAEFSCPFDYELFSDTIAVSGSEVQSETGKAILSFRTADCKGTKPVILAKVGISGVDEEGARKNLLSEIKGWNFDNIVSAAKKIWNDELGVIDVKTDNKNEKVIFYTSLYHTAIQPSLFSDVDGRYKTMKHTIEQDTSYTNYTVFSLWDTFRATHPLYTIIKPDLNRKFINTLLRKYDEMGILPKWELSSHEAGTMIGYHAVSVITDALMKGQINSNIDKLLEACIRSSVYDTTDIDRAMNCSILHNKIMPICIKYKNEKGFIPCDLVTDGSVSKGLEYAYDDWLIAQIARKARKMDIYDDYINKSQAYKEYFDKETKMMRGKLSDGSWIKPFDPKSVERPSNYIEGNAWQWAWFVPHDIDGLIGLWGGKEHFTAGLDSLFTMSSELTGDKNAALDVTGMIGQYAHGNEPGHHIPYLYNYVNEYGKCQSVVKNILKNLYRNDPNGLCGNEDVGQMSAWYVLSAMGIYQVCPGNPVYTLGYPLFDEVTINLQNGKKFCIKVQRKDADADIVSEVYLNGTLLNDNFISHDDIMNGGELLFVMRK